MGYSIDWLPDGRLLVTGDKLRRQEPDGSMVTIDEPAANEIVVDGRGNIYINGADFNFAGGEAPKPGYIKLITADGELRQVADDIQFPNGMVITPDGATLIVGESWGARLTAFDIGADGSLSGRRVFAALADSTPDGICLDEDGAVWLASPFSHEVLRVREGGTITDRIPTGAEVNAYACMLGDADRRTLYVCTAGAHVPEEAAALRSGRIETLRVDVPGAGWP